MSRMLQTDSGVSTIRKPGPRLFPPVQLPQEAQGCPYLSGASVPQTPSQGSHTAGQTHCHAGMGQLPFSPPLPPPAWPYCRVDGGMGPGVVQGGYPSAEPHESLHAVQEGRGAEQAVPGVGSQLALLFLSLFTPEPHRVCVCLS
ncbi:hypothetical protein KIL84_010825 [Mauremys mutica]|uniref:Uncharacterized protein n=1 Tax=Mauremys mutica TaxID=74926 RepID=A0A9D3XCB2_9SAUR|nr:hypothetical protein KIL84_010825 [Mauremys mutica]